MEVKVSKEIKAPAAKVWETIRAFDGINRWLPIVKTCRVEGEGVGAKRYCGFEDGSGISENLLSRDDASRTLTYDIEDGVMPFTGHKAKLSVYEGSSGLTLVTWSSTMQAAPEAEGGVRGMLEGAYNAGIDGLEKLCGGI